MSLLMDALKRAEATKAENALLSATEKSGESSSAHTEELASEPDVAVEDAGKTPGGALQGKGRESTGPELTLDELDHHFIEENKTQEALSLETLESLDEQNSEPVISGAASKAEDAPAIESIPEDKVPKVADKIAQQRAVPRRVVPSKVGKRNSRRLYWGTGFVVLLVIAGSVYFFVSSIFTPQSVITPPASWQVEPGGVVRESTKQDKAAPAPRDDSAKGEVMQTHISNGLDESADQSVHVIPPKQATYEKVQKSLNLTEVKTAPKLSVGKPKAVATTPTDRGAQKPRYQVSREVKRIPLTIQRGRVESAFQRKINKAYEAFQSGDLEMADKLYRQALLQDDANRDAILGRAVIAQKQNRFKRAHVLYAYLLNQNPKDSVALTGLMSLPGDGDSLGKVSRLKMLLQEEPTAAHIHFALGNEYATQDRWPEAQQAYFEANRYGPGNGDYAYNLAVSLERIGKPGAALDYYRAALDAAARRSAGFDSHAVNQRINVLSSGGDLK
ncbi:MAG: hypothetical protein ABW162_08680 [Candidatus Sedimenticola sp. PURPLELP]